MAFEQIGLAYGAFTSEAATEATVDINFSNGGTFDIRVDAEASGQSSSATAEAYLYNGFYQFAWASAGAGADASVSLNNSGDFNIVALANAQAAGVVPDPGGATPDFGRGFAYAYIGDGINQVANALGYHVTEEGRSRRRRPHRCRQRQRHLHQQRLGRDRRRRRGDRCQRPRLRLYR